jgi:hypothetical protein
MVLDVRYGTCLLYLFYSNTTRLTGQVNRAVIKPAVVGPVQYTVQAHGRET